MTSIALLGHGVVGSGVVEVLEKNADSIRKNAGTSIFVKRILDLRDFANLPYADKFTKNFDEILGDPEITIVVEAMGGLEPAYEYITRALTAGKSVATSNKELVAAKGAQLLALARERGVNFLFEASVGGGIPIIRPMHRSLSADKIDEIIGILNGTTNFILTKMIREGMTFSDALALAQKLGYAEANPAADIEGVDACRKICILASLAFGSHVYPQKVFTKGITDVTLEDVKYAESMGCVVKLLSRTVSAGPDKAFVWTGPCLIPRESQLGMVEDVFNGILVRGAVTGDVFFYGKGAGKLPTASAVVSDVIDCAKAGGTIMSLQWGDSDGDNVADWRELRSARYLRCRGTDVLDAAEKVFGAVRRLSRPDKPDDEAAFITPPKTGFEFDRSLESLVASGVEILGNIQVLEL